jgi:hypothetical protein
MRTCRALSAALLAGCGYPTGPPPVTRLEVYAVPTLVDQCTAEVTAWAVTVEQTGQRYVDDCAQPIVLEDLQEYAQYTLDIAGYTSQGLCWRGTCVVTPLPGLGVADCPQATNVCAENGGGPEDAGL